MTTVSQDQAHAGSIPAQSGHAGTGPVTGSKLGIPRRPQVNLLPPEVTHRRQVAGAQHRVIWMIVATLVLIVLAFGGAFLVRADAAIKQEEALATADELLQQKREFSPVVEVMNDIDGIQEAREFVLSTEVNWPSYIYAIAAVIPDDVTIDSLTIASNTAGEGLVEGADALTTAGVGVVTFEATSATLPVASEWIDAMEAVPGLSDVNLQSTELTDEAGEVSYDVAVTIQVTIEALANRVFPDQVDEEPADDAAEADDAADTESGE